MFSGSNTMCKKRTGGSHSIVPLVMKARLLRMAMVRGRRMSLATNVNRTNVEAK
jgi:hypothetical protein